MEWLSEGVEVLVQELDANSVDFDVVIVGSGYGGAVAAKRLAQWGKKVCVLERGREYLPGEFPNDVAVLPKYVRVARSDKAGIIGDADALIDLRIGKDVSALVGSALGGTSQLNAAVAEEAMPEIFECGRWPTEIRSQKGFLSEEYELARQELGVGVYARDPDPLKVRRLEALNRHIDVEMRPTADTSVDSVPGTGAVRFRPLQVAITQATPRKIRNRPQQQECKQCGECCSGCNYWAKNTLTMNYLPDARAHGAKLYTGVSVMRVKPNAAGQDKRWIVEFKPTARKNDLSYRECVRELSARVVILAAGTFGSTEILLRSRDEGLLSVSKRLGEGFSCNGDTLSFGFDQDEDVNGIGWGSADPEGKSPEEIVGPMIGAVIDLRRAKRPEQRVVIEDGAIPGPIAHFAGELLTTAGLLAQLSEFQLKGDRIGRKTDPLAVSSEAMRKTQTMLVMGVDAAAGTLRFGEHGTATEGSLQVVWKDVGKQPLYGAVAGILDATQKLGGIHIPNPIWKPLPDSMSAVLTGATPTGSLVTVHPLGGCSMADDSGHGVVDHAGAVFDPVSPGALHQGLYVMDGSIVPSALGINPLLTITALAERNTKLLAEKERWPTVEQQASEVVNDPPVVDPYHPPPDATVAVSFHEKLVGQLLGDPAPFFQSKLRRLPIALEAVLEFTTLDLMAALESEGRCLDVKGTIRGTRISELRIPEPPGDDDEWHNGPPEFVDPSTSSGETETTEVRGARSLSITACPSVEDVENPVASNQNDPAVWGTIRILHRDRDCRLTRAWRAIRYWWNLRGREEVCRAIRCPEPTSETLGEKVVRYVKWAWSLLKLAVHAGEHRFMTYELNFTGQDGRQYVLHGVKTIAFADGINVWRSFVDLKVEVREKNDPEALASGYLSMDFLDAVRNRPPQILKQPHAVASWGALASAAMLFVRVILKTYLWHFRAPDYPEAAGEELQRPGPVKGVEGPERHPFAVEDGKKSGEKVCLLLSHYWNPDTLDKSRAPVVVTHGFAHSCAIFAADTLETCFVKYLCDAGMDVWLAELRTSTALDSCGEQWTFDQVAEYDLPGAVRKVLELTGKKQVDVVAHCMGSAVFCMGVLRGKFKDVTPQPPSQQTYVSLVHRAVMTQISPYIVGSRSNQLRAELAAFLDDVIGVKVIDVSARKTGDWLPILADRIAATYPPPEEFTDRTALRRTHVHSAPCPPRTDLATCNRITAIYGRNWPHDNINDATHRAMGRLLGRANITTFRQITDFVQQGRVVFDGGLNDYFLDDAAKEHMRFPMMFMHGACSDVFDPATTVQAFDRLSNIQNNATLRRVIKKGYGHLDLWLGKDAHRDGHPYHDVKRFLDHPAVGFRAPNPRHDLRFKPPLRGPVLGWTRHDARQIPKVAPDDFIRVWWELDDTDTDPPVYGVVFLRDKDDSSPQLHGVWPIRVPFMPLGAGGKAKVPVTRYVVADIPRSVLASDRRVWFGSLHYLMLGSEAGDGGPSPFEELYLSLAESELGTFNEKGKGPVPLSFKKITDAFKAKPPESSPRGEAQPSKAALDCLLGSSESIAFFVGSCRYPGTMFESDLSDAALRAISEKLEQGDGAALMLLVGDQIYADATAGVLDTENERERVVKRYRKAWNTKGFSGVAPRIPIYTSVDDHEFWDNFEPSLEGAGGIREAWAKAAYFAWQASPSRLRERERFDVGAPPLAPGVDPSFAHEFVAGGFPFFVLDGRTQRERRSLDTGTRDYALINKQQSGRLLNWLNAMVVADPEDRRPKFVVCGSVFAPFWREAADRPPAYRRRDDGWNGYHTTIHEVVDFIAQHSVANVVFIGGDYHVSAVADMTIESKVGVKVKALCITASPLYAPLPFANGKCGDYLPTGSIDTPAGNSMSYQTGEIIDCGTAAGASNGTFTRVDVHRNDKEWIIEVEVCEAGTDRHWEPIPTYRLPA